MRTFAHSCGKNEDFYYSGKIIDLELHPVVQQR